MPVRCTSCYANVRALVRKELAIKIGIRTFGMTHIELT